MKENKSSIFLWNQVPFLLKSPVFGVMDTRDQKINSLQKSIFRTCKNGARQWAKRWWIRRWKGRKFIRRMPSPLIDLPQNQENKLN
jgi:hypothetical protein